MRAYLIEYLWKREEPVGVFLNELGTQESFIVVDTEMGFLIEGTEVSDVVKDSIGGQIEYMDTIDECLDFKVTSLGKV